MTKEQLDRVLASAEDSRMVIPKPESEVESKLFLDRLVHLFLVDGTLTRHEKKLLGRYAKQCELPQWEVKYSISRIRRKLYQQSLAVLAQDTPKVEETLQVLADTGALPSTSS